MAKLVEHRFNDEWIVQSLLDEGVTDIEAVYKARLEKAPEFAELLLDGKLCTEDLLYAAVRRRHKIASTVPDPSEIERMALSLLPERLCRSRLMIPVSCDHEKVVVAMARPIDLDGVADIEKMTGRKAEPRFCLARNVRQLLDLLLSPELVLEDVTAQLRSEAAQVQVVGDMADAMGVSISSPVIRLVDTLIAKAVAMKASDVHFELSDNESVIRFRIDGIMRSIMRIPLYSSRPVVSRIKIMANLDVAEHRRPQDGRAKLMVSGAEIGLRVSILPTAHGETAVLRLLDKRVASVPFDQLGFRDSLASRFRRLITAKQGFVLVTGPTGSGKTTTLYSAVNLLKSETTNIVTVEDPIEYKLDGINQVQINEKQGLTFAGVLRSVLRQDPNVILVGEIRDRETAEVAFQAATTGHLVLSTLHTNDTVGTVGRLLDIGIEKGRIASGLTGVTAQRLVRRLCAVCRVQEDASDPAALRLLERFSLPKTVWAPRGCTECHLTGYQGRVALIELLKIEREVKDQISSGASENEIYDAGIRTGRLYPMTLDAMSAAVEGRTSLKEAMAIVNAFDIREATQRAPSAYSAGTPPEALAAADSVTRAADDEAPEAEPGTRRRRVLVVDDEKAIRVILKITLERAGFEVLESDGGETALAMVLNERPELLLTDLDMPGLDGRQLVKAVRGDLGMLDMPIVVLTASARKNQREDLLAAGVNDYLTKPFDPKLVARRVESMFARRGLA